MPSATGFEPRPFLVQCSIFLASALSVFYTGSCVSQMNARLLLHQLAVMERSRTHAIVTHDQYERGTILLYDPTRTRT